MSYANTTSSLSTGLSSNSLPNDSVETAHQLNELIVHGSPGLQKSKLGMSTVSGATINNTPAIFGEKDAIKTLQATSGVVAGAEGFAGLYVRGGENDQNLYLLDGLPLLNIYHFGGLFSTFNSQSISRVNFYRGYFPATFSERASSIVDLSLLRPNYDKTEGSVSMGLISGRIGLSTPVVRGHSAVSFSVRRTWFDVISIPALAIINATQKSKGAKKIFNYNFTDAIVNFSCSDKRSNDLSVLLFYGKDNFKLGDVKFDPADKNDIFRKDINSMNWGNWGVSVNYRHNLDKGYLRVQPYVSRALSRDSEDNFNATKYSEGVNVHTSVAPSVFQVGMKEIFSYNSAYGLDVELGLQQVWYDYKTGNPVSSYSGELQGVSGSVYQDHSKNGLLSAFCEIDWFSLKAVNTTFGLRLNKYLSSGRKPWSFEPRVACEFDVSQDSRLNIGYSRMCQYAQQVSSNYMYLPSDAWLPTASQADPLVSHIVSIGYFREFRQKFSIKGEIWYKSMHNIADYRPNTSITSDAKPWYDKLTYGRGWAYGLDIDASGAYRSIDWTLSYGLMWNWRKFAVINSGRRFPAKFDNRHKINVGLRWKINRRMELNGQWEYVTGNRTTLALYNIAPPDLAFPDAPFTNPIDPGGERKDGIELLGDRNNVRLPASHRLNINFSLGGRLSKKMTYQWNFGLYNAYCRLNPFTVTKSYVDTQWNNKGDYRRFKTLSLIPVLPSVSYTINF